MVWCLFGNATPVFLDIPTPHSSLAFPPYMMAGPLGPDFLCRVTWVIMCIIIRGYLAKRGNFLE